MRQVVQALFVLTVLYLSLWSSSNCFSGGSIATGRAEAATTTLSHTTENDDETDEEDDASFVVGGYLPDYRFSIDLNRTALSLTDLYIFSTDLDPWADPHEMFSHQNSNLCCLDFHAHLSKALAAKAYKTEYHRHQPLEDVSKATATTKRRKRSDLKLWLTVGGSGRSLGLQKLFSTKAARARIPVVAQAVVQVCESLGLQGIDIDYHPIGGGWNNDSVEARAFVYFLQILTETLHSAGPDYYLVSTTLRPGMWLPKKVYRIVDRIHVMTYDGTPHAPLETYVKPVVQACLQQQRIPPSKLVLGIPAYGRHEHNPNQVKTFAELYDHRQQQQHNKEITDTCSNYDGFIFDSPATVRLKAQYAKQVGLKGVFFWELGQDKHHELYAPSGFLLQAAASVLTLASTTTTAAAGTLSGLKAPDHNPMKQGQDHPEL